MRTLQAGGANVTSQRYHHRSPAVFPLPRPTVTSFLRVQANDSTTATCRAERRFSALTSRIVSALTALAFVVLLFTAASHQHASASEDLACSVCTAVFNQKANLVTPVVLPTAWIALLYRVAVRPVLRAFYSAQPLLPRICGPPEQT